VIESVKDPKAVKKYEANKAREVKLAEQRKQKEAEKLAKI
jgi:hypothetical protein